MALAAAGTAGLLVLEALPELILCKAIGTTVAGLSDLAQKQNDFKREELETQRVLAENERVISENERIKAEQYAKAMSDRDQEKYRKRLKRELDEKNRKLDEKIEADRQTMQDLQSTVKDYQAKKNASNFHLVRQKQCATHE
ncbi:Oidioi.mRNA.OKI2018_I69.chr2.g4838.t1.cds [Oikopleura dioica]|uniref:Oidioi.mRNA.OKI2018_I69.chr2.g4838.t1.cds n=1 Tax=Oikopleura dioica TaxID=34765 RepID=A0ABN7T2B4_OIKDI|nr:Oidioi.mRNA.OKI2018_I69.chr2.g4838.t1.cds [Oikopleura dioica]